MMDEIKNTWSSQGGSGSADQQEPDKSGIVQESFYRTQKAADDAFFERLEESYSAG